MVARAPLFLARAGYRSRRVSDAARVLPVIGLFLMLLPIFWSEGGGGASSTARVGIYLFVVWGLLIACAAILAPHLPSMREPRPHSDRDDQA